MAFLSQDQLELLGFRALGKEVKVSEKASIYGASRIAIGDYSRIDDFCILSAGEGGIDIGRYVHIACFCSLIGAERIELQDFSGISSRTAIYSSSDDYSGNYLTNPTVPTEFANVISAPVILEKHVITGAGCVILPGVRIGEGSAIGALALVAKNCEPYSIYAGNPAKFLKPRSRKTAELEQKLKNS